MLRSTCRTSSPSRPSLTVGTSFEFPQPASWRTVPRLGIYQWPNPWRYTQLTEVEAAFKCLKSDLAIRPIHYHLEARVEAHIFVAFLAYALSVTLRQQLKVPAPGLTARAVLDKLAAIQMLDVHLPTSDGRCLVMPRYTKPEADHEILLERLGLRLPNQPPPRILGAILPGQTPPAG